MPSKIPKRRIIELELSGNKRIAHRKDNNKKNPEVKPGEVVYWFIPSRFNYVLNLPPEAFTSDEFKERNMIGRKIKDDYGGGEIVYSGKVWSPNNPRQKWDRK